MAAAAPARWCLQRAMAQTHAHLHGLHALRERARQRARVRLPIAAQRRVQADDAPLVGERLAMAREPQRPGAWCARMVLLVVALVRG
jgi:hypothetical protein